MNLNREDVQDHSLAQLILELYLDEERYKELTHMPWEAFQDHDLEFGFRCLFRQLWHTGNLEAEREKYRAENILDRERIVTKLESLGYQGLGAKVKKMMRYTDAPVFEEILGAITSSIDAKNNLEIRRTLEGFLRLSPEDEGYRHKHTDLRRTAEEALERIMRWDRLENWSDSVSRKASDYLVHVLDSVQEFYENLPRGVKDVLIIGTLMTMIVLPLYLGRNAIRSTIEYNGRKSAILENYNGRIADMISGIHGNLAGGSLGGAINDAINNLDYDVTYVPILCTRTYVDGQGRTQIETYVCGHTPVYDYPNPSYAKGNLAQAIGILENLERMDADLDFNHLRQVISDISGRLPDDDTIVTGSDIFQAEMDQLGAEIGYVQSLYQQYYTRIDPGLREDFEKSYNHLILGWATALASLTGAVLSVTSGFAGTLIAGLELNRRAQDAAREGRASYAYDSQTRYRTDRRQKIKNSFR
jgi:hypothetical protein